MKLEKILENVEIIKDKNNGKVNIGSTVKIKYVDDDEEDQYKIVGTLEANPTESMISFESPIAKALLNQEAGATVEVDSPNGKYQVQIIDIN